MGDKVFEQVTEYIDAISEKLGVATEHVIEVMIRQQYVSGTVGVILGAAFLIITAAIVRYTIKVYSEGETERRVKEGYYSLTEPVGVNRIGKIKAELEKGWIAAAISLCAIFATIGIVELVTGVKTLINPEYYVIKEILDVFKGAE